MPLFLTYDNQTLKDGIGAQALRLVGIYSLAKFFRLKYLHSPIETILEEYSHGFSSSEKERVLVSEINSFFNFPDDYIDDTKDSKFVEIRAINFRKLFKFIMKYSLRKKNTILRITFPFPITDRLPSIYDYGIKNLRQSNSAYLKLTPNRNIVIHVRWGYGWKYSDPKYIQTRKRLLPFEYYSAISQAAINYFGLSDEFKIVVHTDLINHSQTWQPSQNQVLKKFEEVNSKSGVNNINIEGYDLNQLIDLPKSHEHEICYCAPFFETFLDMCNANVLIMSTSALSYLAGLINQNLVIWPATHGHAKRGCWLSSNVVGVPITYEQMQKEGPIVH